MFLVLHACNALVYYILSGCILSGWCCHQRGLSQVVLGELTGRVGVLVVGGWGLWGYSLHCPAGLPLIAPP